MVKGCTYLLQGQGERENGIKEREFSGLIALPIEATKVPTTKIIIIMIISTEEDYNAIQNNNMFNNFLFLFDYQRFSIPITLNFNI